MRWLVPDSTPTFSWIAVAGANRNAPKSVAPAVVQPKPGASTTLISNKPAAAPPAQAQKIVAPPGQVNQSTLLPKSDRPDAAAGAGFGGGTSGGGMVATGGGEADGVAPTFDCGCS